jgi:hypothetical protein
MPPKFTEYKTCRAMKVAAGFDWRIARRPPFQDYSTNLFFGKVNILDLDTSDCTPTVRPGDIGMSALDRIVVIVAGVAGLNLRVGLRRLRDQTTHDILESLSF